MHFLHIGKTGGTAVRTALEPYATAGHYTLVLHGHEQRLRQLAPGEGVVFFLRDPVTRFVSGFNSRLRQGLPRYHLPWSPEQKAVFERFPAPNLLALALSSSHAEEKAAAEKAMDCSGHLRKIAGPWFDGEAGLLARLPDIFHIGFQETLAQDFEILKVKLGLPGEIQLPTDEVAAHKTPKNFETRLEPQAVANLTAWYQEDIRFYQFCRQLVADGRIG